MIISDKQKALDKIQHTFIIKSLSKSAIKKIRVYPNKGQP
jgi:hypothetical protein